MAYGNFPSIRAKTGGDITRGTASPVTLKFLYLTARFEIENKGCPVTAACEQPLTIRTDLHTPGNRITKILLHSDIGRIGFKPSDLIT